jgi:hypothetical protein
MFEIHTQRVPDPGEEYLMEKRDIESCAIESHTQHKFISFSFLYKIKNKQVGDEFNQTEVIGFEDLGNAQQFIKSFQKELNFLKQHQSKQDDRPGPSLSFV